MVLEHLKHHDDGLYRYFMKDKIDKEPVGETLTKEIHKHFCGGYSPRGTIHSYCFTGAPRRFVPVKFGMAWSFE
jgi:hypothetical protein